MIAVTKAFGRRAFGGDAANYDAARPSYPPWVFDLLSERCGLRAGAAVLEIGAGTGTATRRLLALGANPLVAVEPDERMAALLRRMGEDSALEVFVAPFETAPLSAGRFDLAVCATAFHWLDEDQALAKVAQLLRPGGWWAAMWNVFGDPERPDPFHDATKHLLRMSTPPPSVGTGEKWFALDTEARFAAMERSGAFEGIEHFARPWSLTLDPEQVVALYATYSNITARTDRAVVLSELGAIARQNFAGGVVRNMITSLFIARRR
jgi:SAM-dependent methyltransferase